MKKLLMVLTAILIATNISGCARMTGDIITPTSEPSTEPTAEPTAQTSTELQFTFVNIPKIDGSTATIPLAEAIYSATLGIDRDKGAELVNFSGTNNAYIKLVDGETDIIFAYEPPAAALEHIKKNNADLELVPIGRDALVFLVNTKNPVKNLSTAQIIDIYQDKITNWKDVGGDDSVIKAFQRNPTSGSQTLMEKLVMNGRKMAVPPAEYVKSEMGELYDSVATYNNSGFALGYNVYYYVSQMKDDVNIAMLSVDNVIPSSDSIRSGSYPFVNDFYVAIRKDTPSDSPARLLFDWIQGSAGQKLIDSEGYVGNK